MLREIREASSPDIYHLHGAWLRAMHYGATEAKRRRKPYIVELMGMYEPWSLSHKWLRKRVARTWYQDQVLRDASCLHVNSFQESDNLRRLGFKNPIAVIPVGVAMDKISADRETLPPIAPWRELGSRKFVLYLARIHPKKGLHLLLRAWARIACENPELRLVIAGTGTQAYVSESHNLAQQLGISSSCIWLGHVDELQKTWLYSNAHCYVLPTQSENFGNTVAEALAHKTPVITSTHTPWTDLTTFHCGWRIENTEKELLRALRESLQQDAKSREAMGLAGEELVRRKYSLELVARQFLELYDWLTTGAAKPIWVLD
jgi:glycosyltransferase involved in cell wall biosynthesis